MKQTLFIIALIAILSIQLFADCDMMAMIARDGHYLSWMDSNSGDYSGPLDFITWQMNRSYQGTAGTKFNDDGYGILYYKENGSFYLDPENLGHNENQPGDPLNQAWYQKGYNTYYMNGSVDWQWELETAKSTIMNDNTQATIVLGHARQGTGGEGNHPFRFEINGDNKLYSFQHNGFLDSGFSSKLRQYLLYREPDWFNENNHPSNWDNTDMIDSEIFFHYLMSYVIDSNGNLLEGIHKAINETELIFEDQNNNLDTLNVYNELKVNNNLNLVNFILSDGHNLYVFRNSPLSDTDHSIGYYDNENFYGIRTYGNGNYDEEINQYAFAVFTPYGKTIIPDFLKLFASYPDILFIKGDITQNINYPYPQGRIGYCFYGDVTIPNGYNISISNNVYVIDNINLNINGTLSIADNASLNLNHSSAVNINPEGELFLDWGSTITGSTPTTYEATPPGSHSGDEEAIPGDRIIAQNGGKITTSNNQSPGTQVTISSTSGEIWDGIQIQNPDDGDDFWFVNCDISGIRKLSMENVSESSNVADLNLYYSDFCNGGQVVIRDGHNLHIEGTSADKCLFQGNVMIPIEAYESSVDISHCWIGGYQQNDGLENGGGIHLYGNSLTNSKINNCTIKYNRDSGVILNGACIAFNNNTIAENSYYGMICYHTTTFSGVNPFDVVHISNNGYAEYLGWPSTFNMGKDRVEIMISDNDCRLGSDNYLLVNPIWDGSGIIDITGVDNIDSSKIDHLFPSDLSAWRFGSGVPDVALLLNSAANDMGNAQYNSAEQTLQQIITDYPLTQEAASAVFYLYHLENLTDQDFATLRTYLLNIQTLSNSYLEKSIEKVITKTYIKDKDYLTAINELETIINNSQIPDDVLLAMIDQGYCYMELAENGERALPAFCSVKTKNLTEYQKMVKNLETQFSFFPDEGTKPDSNPACPVLSASNYPNPFNPTTTIAFSISEDSAVDVCVYNVKGQKIKALLHEDLSSGDHTITWDGTNADNKPVSSGVYFYKVVTNKATIMKKMLLLK